MQYKITIHHKHGSVMLKGNIHATLKAHFGLNKGDYGKTGLKIRQKA